MSQVPKLCNDMMNLGRLQGFEVHTITILIPLALFLQDMQKKLCTNGYRTALICILYVCCGEEKK